MMTLKCERGGVIVYIAVTMLLMLCFVALALDVGRLILVKSEAQAAVDGAALKALAGVQQFRTVGLDTDGDSILDDGDRSDFTILMNDYNDLTLGEPRNLVMGDSAHIDPALQVIPVTRIAAGVTDISFPAVPYTLASGVRIVKPYTVKHLFAGILGIESTTFTVRSTVLLGGPICLQPTLPLVIINDSVTNPLCSGASCNVFQTYPLTPGPLNSAAFYSVGVTIPSSANCQAAVADPANQIGVLCSGSSINLNNGVITACLQDIEAECNSRNCSQAAPWTDVLLPVIDASSLANVQPQDNNVLANIVGFARISVSAINVAGANSTAEYALECNRPIPNTVGGGLTCGSLAEIPGFVAD